MRLGRCNDPRGLASPSLRLPAGGSAPCQRGRHYRRRAAPSRACSRTGTLVPAKLERERSGRDDRWDPSPPAWGCRLGRRSRPLGPSWDASKPPMPAREHCGLGAQGDTEGTRDAWAENSPAAESGSAEAASLRCAPASPPVREPARLLPPPPSPFSSSFSSSFSRAPGPKPSRSDAPRGCKAPVVPAHLWVGAARIPPPSPPPFRSLPAPSSRAPTPPQVPSPPSAPCEPKFGTEAVGFPGAVPGRPARAPLAHPVRPAAARRLPAPRSSPGAK